MNWWLSLSIFEHILFAISLASTMVILTKLIFTLAKFYSVDKLNTEPEDIDNYEAIANNDPEIEKHIPGFVSIMSINVFLASAGWSFFLFSLFLSFWWTLLLSFVFGVMVLVLYGLIDYHIKKQNFKKEKVFEQDFSNKKD